MKKKKISALLVILLLLIAAGVFVKQFLLPTFGTGPERALPLIDAGKRQVLVKMENPAIFKNKLLNMMRLLGEMPKSLVLPVPGGVPGLPGNEEGYADELIHLMDAAEQAAFLVIDDEGEKNARFYLSFIPNADVFDKLVSGSENTLVSIEKWEQDKGAEGWILKPALPLSGSGAEVPALYLLRSGTADGAPVLVSNAPESIDEMIKALKSGSARLRIKRYNPAPDYMQVRFPVRTTTGEEKTAVSEIAWIEDETSAHAQFYSDAFGLMTGRAVPKSGLRGDDLPLLGSGDLALVAAVDIPYACFMAFPTADNSIERVLKEAGALLPSQYREDLRKVMEEGRISIVAVAGDGGKTDPDTAYIVLESKAKEAMDRLVSLPKTLMSSATLQGWDSCHTVEIGRSFNAILAQRGNVLLLGIGSLDSYSRKARITDDIKDFAAPRDLANLVATPSFWHAAAPAFKQRLLARGIDPSFLDDAAMPLGTVQLRVITPEKADLGLYWGASTSKR